MKIIDSIKHILVVDAIVSQHQAEEQRHNQQGIALIAAIAFAVMSLLNIKEHSLLMLATTSGSSLFLLIGYFVSKYKHNASFLRGILYVIFVVVFTSYLIAGGNDGFAALWLVTATYAVMLAIDFKMGFLISCYYLILLLLVFNGPLTFLLQFAYNSTFMLRFPFFYAINFAFAIYIVVTVRQYQYQLLLKRQKLEQLSIVDLSTGLKNRNYFVQYEESFSTDKLTTLLAVFIDVNGLHELNNRDGHAAGDRMLRCIADLCQKHFSAHAVYRMGGDEFLILCENAEEADVLNRVQQLVDDVEQEGYSISYGVELQQGDFDLDTLIKNADEKMILFKKAYYEQKNRRER